MGAAVTSHDVEATGTRLNFPAVHGLLTFGPLEAALLGGDSLKGAVVFVPEEGVEPLGFLSGIENVSYINITSIRY